MMHCEVAHRWLHDVGPGSWPTPIGTRRRSAAAGGEPAIDGLFHGRLLDNMYDAVVFIDAESRVTLWNRGTERLTGVSGASVCGQAWQIRLLELSRRKGPADPRGRLPRLHGDPLRRPVASPAEDSRTGPAVGVGRLPRHPGHRPQGRHPRGRAAVPRRLFGNLAGTAVPEPARKGHQGPVDPGGQPGRVRPRPRHVRRRPPAAASARAA